ELLEQGDGIYQMMQVTGEEGITEDDFITWQKSLLLDMVYLQQDAFDEIDACMPRERQLESFRLLKGLIDTGYHFKDKDEARSFFTELTSVYKNWNYSASGSTEFNRYRKEIVDLAVQHGYIETQTA
ncbi:MAG: ATP synthase beta subunit C-terminal domain-containing protein, partial [Methylovulum sp.]